MTGSVINSANSIPRSIVHISSSQRQVADKADPEGQHPHDFWIDIPRTCDTTDIRLLSFEIPQTSYNISAGNNEIYFNEFNLFAKTDNHVDDWTTANNLTGYGLAMDFNQSTVNHNGTTGVEPMHTYADMLKGVIAPGNYAAAEYANAVEVAMNNAQVMAEWDNNPGVDVGAVFIKSKPRNTYTVRISPTNGILNISAQTLIRDWDMNSDRNEPHLVETVELDFTRSSPWVSTTTTDTAAMTPFPFAVRAGSLHNGRVQVYSAVQNPYDASVSEWSSLGMPYHYPNYQNILRNFKNFIQDSPIRIILKLSNNHRFCPGDHVVFTGRTDGGVVFSPNHAFVIFVNGMEVHLLVDELASAKTVYVDASIRLDTKAMANNNLMQKSAPLGMDPAMYRAGLLVAFQDSQLTSGVRTSTFQRFVYANAATDYMKFYAPLYVTGSTSTEVLAAFYDLSYQSSPFEGDIELLPTESQAEYASGLGFFRANYYSGNSYLYYVIRTNGPHMLPKKSLIVCNTVNQGYNTVGSTSFQKSYVLQVAELHNGKQGVGDCLGVAMDDNKMTPTGAYHDTVPALSVNAFECYYNQHSGNPNNPNPRMVIGAGTVRGHRTIDLESETRRVAFISLEHPVVGELGIISVGDAGLGPFFGRVQLDQPASAIIYSTPETVVGGHVFRTPTEVDRLRVRLLTEDGSPYALGGAPWSMAISLK